MDQKLKMRWDQWNPIIQPKYLVLKYPTQLTTSLSLQPSFGGNRLDKYTRQQKHTYVYIERKEDIEGTKTYYLL